MPLHWDPGNLLTHTAKHYVGSPTEEWRQLPGAPPETWDEWRARADAAHCSYAHHPAHCREPQRCGEVHTEASAPYRSLVDQDWAFALAHDLIVEYPDERGQRCLCGTGTSGVFIAVAAHTNGSRTAKTSFRPAANPSSGFDPVLGAVRKMRAQTSSTTRGRSMTDLLRLETALLRPLRGQGDPFTTLATALRTKP